MKKLKKYCNIVPILAKGDSYTVKEIREMKLNLIKEAYDYKIDWFDFAEVKIVRFILIIRHSRTLQTNLKKFKKENLGLVLHF
jgi:septin family protein